MNSREIQQIRSKNLEFFKHENQICRREKVQSTINSKGIFQNIDLGKDYFSDPRYLNETISNFSNLIGYIKFKFDSLKSNADSSYSTFNNLKQMEVQNLKRSIVKKDIYQVTKNRSLADVFKAVKVMDDPSGLKTRLLKFRKSILSRKLLKINDLRPKLNQTSKSVSIADSFSGNIRNLKGNLRTSAIMSKKPVLEIEMKTPAINSINTLSQSTTIATNLGSLNTFRKLDIKDDRTSLVSKVNANLPPIRRKFRITTVLAGRSEDYNTLDFNETIVSKRTMSVFANKKDLLG